MSDNGKSLPPPTLADIVDHHERTLYGEADENGVVRHGLVQSVERIEGMVQEIRALLQAMVDQDLAETDE